MKILNKININKKIPIILVILILFTFMVPNYVQAGIGSSLTKNVKKMVAMIVDACLMVAQKGIVHGSDVAMAVKIEDQSNPTDVWDDNKEIFYLSRLLLTPDAIFQNKILLLDPDFISPIDATGTKVGGDTSGDIYIALVSLRQKIQNWYKGIRNLSLVGLMSVLIYVGIRILMVSISEEKAKYKKLLVYWFTAICLIFLLHYIMAFAFYAADQLTLIFSGGVGATSSNEELELPAGSNLIMIDENDARNKYVEALTSIGINNIGAYFDSGTGSIKAIPTIQQYSRLMINSYGVGGFAYLMIYIALVGYTVFFFIVYLLRVLKLAFLTMIAPLICLTYPIDKISDGQAQAFNKWLKEFIYNVLIQPFHLLIYTVIVGLALGLAETVPLFAIIAIAAILPIEKLMKEMFGFNKAPGVGAFSGAAAGSMVANTLQKIGSKPGNKNPDSQNGNQGNSEKETNKPYKEAKTDDFGAYELDANENNQNAGANAEANAEANAGANNAGANAGANAEANNAGRNNDENVTPQEAMQETDQEKFGTSDFNPEEYDKHEREMKGPEKNNEEQIKEHEKAEIESREAAKQAKEEGDDDLYNSHKDNERYHQEEAERLRQEEQANEKLEEGEEAERLREKEQENEEKPKPNQKYRGQGIKKGIGAIGNRAKRSVQNKIGWKPNQQYKGQGVLKGAWNVTKNVGRVGIKGAKGAAKLGIRTGMGAGIAMVAGSAALITGNPKAIAGAVTAGAIAGSRLGKRATTATGKGYSSLKDTYDRGKLGENYNQAQAKKESEEWKNSKSTDNRYSANFSSEKFIGPDGRKTSEKQQAIDLAGQIREESGEQNDDALMRAVKMTKGFAPEKPGEQPLTLDEAKTIPSVAAGIKDSVFDDRNKYENEELRIQKKFMDKGVDNSRALAQAKKILKDTAKFKGTTIPGVENRTNETPQLEKPKNQQRNVPKNSENKQTNTNKKPETNKNNKNTSKKPGEKNNTKPENKK